LPPRPCSAYFPAWANDDEDPHAILFSGRDLWLNGAFVHGGILFAPSGLDQDGLLLKILFAGGLYRYDAKKIRREWPMAGVCSKTCWEAFTEGYRHLRLGGHITSMKAGRRRLGSDSQGRASPFLRLNMLKRL